MTETEWTRLICRELEKLGCVVLPLVAGAMQQPGWPDRYVCSRHGDWWLEFKGVNTRVGRAQWARMRALNGRLPGKAWVVRQPGRLETQEGELVSTFDTAAELLRELAMLSV